MKNWLKKGHVSIGQKVDVVQTPLKGEGWVCLPVMGMCSVGDLQKPYVCRPVCLISGSCRAGLAPALKAMQLYRVLVRASATKYSPTFCYSSRTQRSCFSLEMEILVEELHTSMTGLSTDTSFLVNTFAKTMSW